MKVYGKRIFVMFSYVIVFLAGGLGGGAQLDQRAKHAFVVYGINMAIGGIMWFVGSYLHITVYVRRLKNEKHLFQ